MKLTAKQRAALDALPNEQQRMFCIEVVRNGGNQTQAAISAGYAEVSARQQASEIMAKPNVMAAVAALREPIYNSKIASIEEQRERWSAIARGEVKDTAIVKDVGECEVSANLATRMRADELLGKSTGAFVERLEHSGPAGTPIAITIDLASAKKIARGEQE